METNKLVVGIVATAIAVIVLAGVLMPALNNATETHEKLTNDGYFRMAELTEGSDYNISWDHTNPKVLTVNDKTIDLSFLDKSNYSSVTVFASDTYVIRAMHQTGTDYAIQKYGGTFESATTQNEKDVSITISGISASLTFGTSTTTETITEGYVADTNGSFVMKKTDVDAYIHTDSSIIVLAGVSSIDGGDVTIYATGTVDDGLDFNAIRGVTGATYSFGDPTFNMTDVEGYVDLNSISSIVFDFTKNDTTATFTYTYFIVPYEVTAEKAVHLDPAMNTILSVIPIIIIVAVLLGVVAIFMIRRE